MTDDDMTETIRSFGFDPTRLQDVRIRQDQAEAVLDEVRADLGLNPDDRYPDLQICSEVADLLGPEQPRALREWFRLRLEGMLEREYNQVGAAILLSDGEPVDDRFYFERKPAWLHSRICDFLGDRVG